MIRSVSPPSTPSIAVEDPRPAKPRDPAEQAILAKVRDFLLENFLYQRPPDFRLHEDDRLLERGVIDSMGVVEMITFIEETFGIKVSEDEISEANLGSLSAITQYVITKPSARTW